MQHKFYVENLKISTIKADLSWSGALPAGFLSSSLFKALTFERLPVRLRPFSNAQYGSIQYGSIQDHLQILKTHYVSAGRILDLLIGISSHPMFLFRAVLHTFREGCATILNTLVSFLDFYTIELKKTLPQDLKSIPVYDDENPLGKTERSTDLLKRVFAPFMRCAIHTLKNTSFVITLFSLQLKYSPRNSSFRQTRGLIRSRNPRLFAHLDGKDLLVEYVEGENAGKALLSRVRAGQYLGEGYLYHAEGVWQRKEGHISKKDLDSTPLILMVTLERLLLLTGKLDENFCSVEWEAYLANIINIEIFSAKHDESFPFDEIILWHLSDPDFSVENKAMSGIDVLQCKSIYVPHVVGIQVLQKMKQTESRFESIFQLRSLGEISQECAGTKLSTRAI